MMAVTADYTFKMCF